MTSKTNEIYPISLIENQIKKERYGHKEIKCHPVMAIVIIIHKINKSIKKKENKMEIKILTTTKKRIILSQLLNQKIETEWYRSVSKSENEKNMLIRFMNIIKDVDFICGFKCTNLFYMNSIQYVLKRLIKLGRPITFLGTFLSHSIRKLTEFYHYQPDKYNCLKFTSIIDLFYYIQKKNETAEKKIITDSFEHICRQLLSENNYYEIPYFTDISSYLNNKNSLKNVKSKSNEDVKIIKMILNYLKQYILIFQKEKIIQKTLEFSKQWHIDTDNVWTIGQSTIFKNTMFSMLHKMRNEKNTPYYIVCSTYNFGNAEKRYKKNDYIFENQGGGEGGRGGRGGRTIRSQIPHVTVGTVSVDFSNNYASLITDAQLGFCNIVFSRRDNNKEEDEEGEEGEDDDDDKIEDDDKMKYLKTKRSLKARTNQFNIHFIRFKNTKNMPFIRSLKKLTKLRSKYKNDPIKKSAIKKQIVSMTGCLATTFKFPFRNLAAGEVMRFIGRNTFDRACKNVNDHYIVQTNPNKPQNLELIEKKEYHQKFEKQYKNILSIHVIAGLTDGFEIMICSPDDNSIGIECLEKNLIDLGNKLCKKVMEDIKSESFSFGLIPCNMKVDYDVGENIFLKIERIPKQTIYFLINDKVWLDRNNKIQYKGTVLKNLKYSKGQRWIFEKVIYDVFKRQETNSDDESDFPIQKYINMFEEKCKEIIKNVVEEEEDDDNILFFIKYARATKKMHEFKFDENPKYQLARILKDVQKDLSTEILTVNQYLGYVYILGKKEVIDCRQFDIEVHQINVKYYVNEVSDVFSNYFQDFL